jgi:hypothetical protein
MDANLASTDYFLVTNLVLLNTNEYYIHLIQYYIHEK